MLTQMVLDNPSPYQISMNMRVSREVATQWFRDESGTVYVKNMFGTTYIYDSKDRTLTASVNTSEL